MNKIMTVVLVGMGFIISGCGNQQNQATSSVPAQVSEGQSVQTASQTQKTAQQTASDLAKKAQVLLAQAKQYLDQGKLDEAISVAQQVLSFDPKNIDAQKIIDMAKAQLKALAEKQAAGMMNKIGTFGQ